MGWWSDFNQRHNLIADLFPTQNTAANAAWKQAYDAAHAANHSGNSLVAKVAVRRAQQEAGIIAKTSQGAIAVANAPATVVHAGTSALKTAAIIVVVGMVVIEVIPMMAAKGKA